MLAANEPGMISRGLGRKVNDYPGSTCMPVY